MASEKAITQRARVRLSYHQKQWPEYLAVERLKNRKPNSAAERDELLAEFAKAEAALKARREREFPFFVEQCRVAESTREALPTQIKNSIRARWRKRMDREILVMQSKWNLDTQDDMDLLDLDNDAFSKHEEERLQQWRDVERLKIQAKYHEWANEEILYRAGRNPDWVDTWKTSVAPELDMIAKKYGIKGY